MKQTKADADFEKLAGIILNSGTEVSTDGEELHLAYPALVSDAVFSAEEFEILESIWGEGGSKFKVQGSRLDENERMVKWVMDATDVRAVMRKRLPELDAAYERGLRRGFAWGLAAVAFCLVMWWTLAAIV